MKYNPLVKYTVNENATSGLTNLVILFPSFHQKEFKCIQNECTIFRKAKKIKIVLMTDIIRLSIDSPSRNMI